MFYSKVRSISSHSIIDICAPEPPAKLSYNHSSSSSSYLYNHFHRCHSSFSHDSLNKEFVENTKQKCKDLFHQTNFNQLLNQIQSTLQPVVKQLREEIQNKKTLSKQERLACLKTCTKFITDTLMNDDQFDVIYRSNELIRLQQLLNRYLSKSQNDVFTQTETSVNIDLRKLKINDETKVSFVSKPIDQLARQKAVHRSMSRTFRKLNNDLQKLNHEIPFQSHLAKYHKHNHHEK